MKGTMPQLGFGTWNLSEGGKTKAITKALEIGYRLIDTADIYGSHHNIAEAVAQTGVNRANIFITTKLWRNSLEPQKVSPAVERFLHELNTDYIDLLLIHRPSAKVPIYETLNAMEEMVDHGLVKHLGVSNFDVEGVREARASGVNIVNNQIEYHPTYQQDDIVEYCKQNDIVTTAYSPLGRGKDLNLDEVENIAKSINATQAQVILSWLRQKGLVSIPKSSDPLHIQENFESLKITLSKSQMEKLNNISSQGSIV